MGVPDIPHNGFGHVQFLQGKVAKNLPRLPLRPDVVIMDPPRAGVTAAVIDHILRSRPGKVIYVSCDPQPWWLKHLFQ
ncbi:putative RNA methyltransferase/cg2084 [Peptococcaceae bacterium CEB3]|nr:putative RNA methyltransferase/cg2084 [Peptococcaceae bacterium CEB3]